MRRLFPFLVVLAWCLSSHAAVDPQSGLIVDTGYKQIRAQCTACHSSRLIVQNRSNREGWQAMIRWMQDTQGLWSLGDSEPVILDYLARNYGPTSSGRRRPLEVEEWRWPD